MANVIEKYLTKRRNRSSNSTEGEKDSPDKKKAKNQGTSDEEEEASLDEVLAVLNMSESVSEMLNQILERLQKLDKIESSLDNIEGKLQNLESRTQRLEESESTAKQELNDLKEGLKNVNIKLKDKMESMENTQGVNTANLSQKIKELEEQAKSLHNKNLYLEAYSRRENIKFMNIQETRRGADQREDTEGTLRRFLEQELGYEDSKRVEIQRVHRIGKGKNGGPWPILARFLRYKDCEDILASGRRLRGTNFQMFKDLPTEIIDRRKPQVETLKKARRNGMQAAFSSAQPDKLYINGEFWPVGRELAITGR